MTSGEKGGGGGLGRAACERPHLNKFLSSPGKQGRQRQNPHGLIQNRSLYGNMSKSS